MSLLAQELQALQSSIERYGQHPSDAYYAQTLAQCDDVRGQVQAAQMARKVKRVPGWTDPSDVALKPGTMTHDIMALFRWRQAERKTPPTWTMAGIVRVLGHLYEDESIKRTVRKLRNTHKLLVWCGNDRLMASRSSGMLKAEDADNDSV